MGTAPYEQLDGDAVMCGPLSLYMFLSLAMNPQKQMHVCGL